LTICEVAMQTPTYYDLKLSAHADSELAKKRRKNIQPFRGIRGVPHQIISEILAEDPVAELPADRKHLSTLFAQAHEDGLVAIGLLSVACLQNPLAALELAEEWIGMIDDVESADALAKLVIGPAVVSLGLSFQERLDGAKQHSALAYRIEIISMVTLFPEEVKGPCVAALRSQLNQQSIIFSPTINVAPVLENLGIFYREENHVIRKSILYLLRVSASWSYPELEAFLSSLHQGPPRWLRPAIKKGKKTFLKRVDLINGLEDDDTV